MYEFNFTKGMGESSNVYCNVPTKKRVKININNKTEAWFT